MNDCAHSISMLCGSGWACQFEDTINRHHALLWRAGAAVDSVDGAVSSAGVVWWCRDMSRALDPRF